LSAILGWTKVLNHKSIDRPTLEEGLTSIASSRRALSRLVDDLFDASRAATGKLRLDLVPMEVSAAIERALENIKPTADAKSLKVSASVESGRMPIMADAERLGQVFWNLLANAVKFTPVGGKIDIAASRENNEAVIRVSDTGVGIAPEFLPQVFDRFRQYDSARTRKLGGLGLGLSIAKKLVEMHGGTIHAESSGLERGSTFTVRLPLPSAAPGSRSDPRDCELQRKDSKSDGHLHPAGRGRSGDAVGHAAHASRDRRPCNHCLKRGRGDETVSPSPALRDRQ